MSSEANVTRMLRNDAAGIVRDLNECQRRYEYATAAAKERIEGEMSKMVARLTAGDRITYRDDAGVWRLVLTEEERTEDAALATTRKEPMPVAGYTVHEKDGVVTLGFTNGGENVAVQMPIGDAERLGSRLKAMAELRETTTKKTRAQPKAAKNGRPTDFVICYEDGDKYAEQLARVGGEPSAVDPIYTNVYEDAPTFDDALKVAKSRGRKHQTTVYIYQRVDIFQEEDSEVAGLLLWNWADMVCVADVTHGELRNYGG